MEQESNIKQSVEFKGEVKKELVSVDSIWSKLSPEALKHLLSAPMNQQTRGPFLKD